MRTSVVARAVALCVAMSAALACSKPETATGTAAGGQTSTDTQTVTGKVVDFYCYDPETGANTGMDHVAAGAADEEGRECAWACVKWEGQPVGLVTADGKLYQLAGGVVADNNAKIAPHVTHTVTVTGKVAEKQGILMLTASDFTMVAQ